MRNAVLQKMGLVKNMDSDSNAHNAAAAAAEEAKLEANRISETEQEAKEVKVKVERTIESEDAMDFLNNEGNLIVPSAGGAEWTDYECTSADDLLDAARIFDCVNLPAFGELQCNLTPPHAAAGGAGAASSSLGSSTSSSTVSASVSVSSPSSSSWIPTNIKNEEAMHERHSSSCAAAPSTPSVDQDVTICGGDSATSTSYQSSLVPPLPPENTAAINNSDSNLDPYPDHTDKIDVLEELQNLDLLDGSDVWDPFSGGLDGFPSPGGSFEEGERDDISSEELPMVFFEWLKSNRDSISPEDLRNIKLKRSTIETAAKQLGGGRRGMLHLLKLILAWVQNHHLQRKRKLCQQQRLMHDGCPYRGASAPSYFVDQYNLYGGGGLMVQQDHGFEHQGYSSMPADPSLYSINSINPPGAASEGIHHHPAKYRRVPLEEGSGFAIQSECQHMIQPIDAWPTSTQMTVFQNQQHLYNNPGLGAHEKYRYPSAAVSSHIDYMNYRSTPPAVSTKEARKNRMARQRRSLSHHHHHHHQNRHWSSSPTSLPPQPAEPVNLGLIQYQQQRQSFMQTDRRQGWKPEKNLKFLLQKVLKQSDVGNLGRIVLPKKEAETHLPELEARDGISIAMEDIVTSRVWNMRYRFWPNNKSRMYLLENTGDFVRSNGLQEGDFIVIYSDTKTGKYMIRGVKVPRTDTSAAVVASATAATKCTNGSSSSVPDGGEAKLFKMGKRYGTSTSQTVAVTFADSMADASSSVSDATVHSCPEGDPFLVGPFTTKGTATTTSPPQDNDPNLERFPSLESGDLTIEEILDLVDTPDLAATTPPEEQPSTKSFDDMAESKG